MNRGAPVRVEALAAPAQGPRLVLDDLPGALLNSARTPPPRPGAAPPADPALEDAWLAMRRDNDALFDGPILQVTSFDAASGVLRARPSSFKHLATASVLARDVRQLGVVGWLTGRDAAGAERILLARRSAGTRVYPGQWENAPAGGVDLGMLAPPPPGLNECPASALYSALQEESREELGLRLPAWPATGSAARAPVARSWIVDDLARSLDVVFEVELGAVDPRRTPCFAAGGGRWEYTDAAWLTRAELAAFAERREQPLSPPTLALARFLGWLTPRDGSSPAPG